MQDIAQLLRQRRSVNHFDADRPLDSTVIHELAELATLAPSAYHLQNWQFIVLHTPEAKARLLPHTFGQQKVVEAAVTYILCGELDGHQRLSRHLQPVVDQGIMSLTLAANMSENASTQFATVQAQREEAIRSVSLAAMALMLAAEARGLVSCPMSGFDAAAVQAEFGLADNLLPVLLLPVGYEASGNWPQKPRRPLAEVLRVL